MREKAYNINPLKESIAVLLYIGVRAVSVFNNRDDIVVDFNGLCQHVQRIDGAVLLVQQCGIGLQAFHAFAHRSKVVGVIATGRGGQQHATAGQQPGPCIEVFLDDCHSVMCVALIVDQGITLMLISS